MANQRTYTIDLKWTGKTEDPRTYNRSFYITSKGKEDIAGSADSSSRGDPSRWNPEEMFLASLASCHMLWYLYLCAAAKIVITEYVDFPTGIVDLNPAGKGKFIEATLNPQLVITDASRIQDALKLQSQAHEKCFIVNSVNFEVKLNPQVKSL